MKLGYSPQKQRLSYPTLLQTNPAISTACTPKPYRRLQTLVEHWADVGKALNRAVDKYNAATGSLERRLMPSARHFEEMKIADMELPTPTSLDAKAHLLIVDTETNTRSSQNGADLQTVKL